MWSLQRFSQALAVGHRSINALFSGEAQETVASSMAFVPTQIRLLPTLEQPSKSVAGEMRQDQAKAGGRRRTIPWEKRSDR